MYTQHPKIIELVPVDASIVHQSEVFESKWIHFEAIDYHTMQILVFLGVI